MKKMKSPEHISPPVLQSARKLSPLELNSYRFDVKHTVLTPELLEKMHKNKK